MTITSKLETEQFDEDVKAAQVGLDAIDQGRVRPFEDYLAEHRQRYPDARTTLMPLSR